MSESSLSVVIPAYNEKARIVASLRKIELYLENRAQAWEVIVVDDGSSDGTAGLVEDCFSRSPHRARLRLLRNETNRGKGYSVRRGFLSAGSDIVLFTDADLSAPIEELEKLVPPITEGRYDATFGSRALRQSEIRKAQPGFRQFGGKCFNALMRLITGLPFHDTQCGFKAFRRQPFVPVFERQRIERFGFDVEVLYLARKHGLRLAEIPVVWSHCQDTKVHFLRDATTMFLDLWRIRWYDWTRRYRRPVAASQQAKENS